MTNISTGLIVNFLAFLLVPFLFAILARKIKISPVVGYIIGGLVLGNLFEGFYSKEVINNFAYFGIVILLFTVGLEVNFDRLIILKKYIVFGGFLQLLVTVLALFLLNVIFNFNFVTSFLIAIALSSSSTTLVAKIIQDRGEEGTFTGEVAMGVLIFQDIAFIPFLIIFTSVSHQSSTFISVVLDILFGLVKSTIIIFILYYLGRGLIPKIFNKIARTSRELLNLFIIVFIFIITYLSLLLDIPILIGVFIAGVLLAQTLEHYHIFSEVRPIRDLLAVIFFVFIGLNIKIGVIFPLMPKILIYTLLVMIIKLSIIVIIFLFLKFHTKTAFSLGSYLFQIDEDAFILMSTLFAGKVIGYDDYLFVITAVLLTLIVTPIVIQNKEKSYSTIMNFIKKYLPFLSHFLKTNVDRDQSPLDSINIKKHVVICGYGRIGGYIGRSLMISNIPFIAIDYNFHIAERAKKEGVSIIYGDPADYDILDYAQVDEALVLILAVPESHVQEQIILNAKKLNPDILIIGRVHRQYDQKRLKDLGVDSIIHPEFEASLSIIRKLLLIYKLSREDIVGKIKRLKIEHGFF